MIFGELAGRFTVADLPVGSLFIVLGEEEIYLYPDNKVIH